MSSKYQESSNKRTKGLKEYEGWKDDYTNAELEQMASKMLRKDNRHNQDIDLRPKDQPKRAVVGITSAERKKIIRAGERILNRLMKKYKREKEQETK